MDNKTYAGQLGELKVMADLAHKGYHVFNQTSGKAPFDVIASKGNKLIRISVKTTGVEENKVGKYTVSLRRVRSNKTENKVYKIEAGEFDVLAVYIIKADKVVYLSIDQVVGGATLSIHPDEGLKI